MRRPTALAALAIASPALAHVELTAPNGGETLVIGTQTTIEWVNVITHQTLNWDLYLATESDQGPWEPIALDLPPGDLFYGSEHSYEWTVTGPANDTAWVMVVQDNEGFDYEDVSSKSFAIVPAPATPALLGLWPALTRRRRAPAR